MDRELTEIQTTRTGLSDDLTQVVETADDTTGRVLAAEVLKMDVKATYDAAIASIVTVHSGEGQGSGFAYDVQAAGGFNSVIVTNHDVIENCAYSDGPTVSVETHSGEVPTSQLWNWDEKNDLAFIMTSATLDALTEAYEGNIGDPVIAIGYPQDSLAL